MLESNEQSKISEDISDLSYKAYYAYNHESPEKGIAVLDSILAMPIPMNEFELAWLNRRRDIWMKAIDQDFALVEHPSASIDVEILSVKEHNCLNVGDFQGVMRYSWLRLQYCASGTYRFLSAVANVVEAARLLDDIGFARHAAEMFLSHYDLMVSASKYPFTPVGNNSPSSTHAWATNQQDLRMVLPWDTALEYIAEDGSDCWVRILIMRLETSLEEDKKLGYYPAIIVVFQGSFYGLVLRLPSVCVSQTLSLCSTLKD